MSVGSTGTRILVFGDMHGSIRVSSGGTPSLAGARPFPEGAGALLSHSPLWAWFYSENCSLLFDGTASWLREGLCGAQTQSEGALEWIALLSVD